MDVKMLCISDIDSPGFSEYLKMLYGADQMESQKARYRELLEKHRRLFGEKKNVWLVSAPGRTEIGGNHTDHNNGKVLAASIHLDVLCAVSPRDDMWVHFNSEGYPGYKADMSDIDMHPQEKGTTLALIRGVAAGMKQHGYEIGGFEAAVTSDVAAGSGLSSSAALEMLLTGIFDALYNDFDMPYILRAKIGQYAENVYFGKPSGMLDQLSSAAGGMMTADFRDTEPEVHPFSFDFAAHGYHLVVVATGGSHVDLTEFYAAIPRGMKEVAAFFGKKTMRGVTLDDMLESLSELRSHVSDLDILRAFHYLRENERVGIQVMSLEQNRLDLFFQEIIDSGRSSFMYLQNVHATSTQQGLSLALCLAELILKDIGAWRVHGGGFAGTTLNFVPFEMLSRFRQEMENAFGAGCCTVLRIRPVGVAAIKYIRDGEQGEQ